MTNFANNERLQAINSRQIQRLEKKNSEAYFTKKREKKKR